MTRDAASLSSLPPKFRAAGKWARLVALGGLGICVLVWILLMILGNRWPAGAAAFYKAYLFAWLLMLGVSLGAMVLVMIHHLTGGEWGCFVRRSGEAAANVLPLLFVLFVPILAGLRHIYPWADPNYHNPVIHYEHRYLNAGFFILRYILYFAVWMLLAWLLRSLSLRHDRSASTKTERRLYRLSAAGLLAYFVTMSLAAVDWIMSLEPGWYSTVFGFIVCMGQAVSGTAVLVVVLQLLSSTSPLVERLRPRHFNDLATLLITAVILWAYTSFSQLLIIWMGNIQGEIPWYVKRTHGPWRGIAGLLVFLGFVAPFVLLLQRGIKKNGPMLLRVCVGLLVMRVLDVHWMIAPSGRDPSPGMHWLNVIMSIVALAGIGGAWVAGFLWLLDGPPLMPMGDTVPVEVIPSDELILEPRACDDVPERGTQPGIA